MVAFNVEDDVEGLSLELAFVDSLPPLADVLPLALIKTLVFGAQATTLGDSLSLTEFLSWIELLWAGSCCSLLLLLFGGKTVRSEEQVGALSEA